ncbi:hypothetical protein J4437_06765 [Candidatus Woesearchaeota archaeon]|nr:hypothetical protein [Candidatus Woesearchaeota archaeon]
MPGFYEDGREPVFDGPDTAVADLLDDTPKPPVVVAPPQKKLETIIGNLRAYSQLEPGTLLHADELMAQQVLNPALREQAYYVADFALYTLEGTGKKKTPTLWLARYTAQEPNNLILNHLDDAVNSSFEQLTQTHNYRPSLHEAQKVMEAQSTLKIDLTQLRLKKHDDEFGYIEISTTNYNKLNPEQRKLAERFYGQGTDFDRAMATLKSAGINTTQVFLLNPTYVQKEAVNPIGRAAWRDNFHNGANSSAIGYNVGDSGGLLGVRRRLPATIGGASQNLEVPSAPSASLDYETAYQMVMQHPELLDQNKAAGLSQILTNYLSQVRVK